MVVATGFVAGIGLVRADFVSRIVAATTIITAETTAATSEMSARIV